MAKPECEYLITWPPSDDPSDPGQRDCGKPATRLVNQLLCCEECYAALVAEDDPDLIEDVGMLLVEQP